MDGSAVSTDVMEVICDKKGNEIRVRVSGKE